MGKNGYWLMLDDKYKSFDEYLEKIKADERAKGNEFFNFDEVIKIECEKVRAKAIEECKEVVRQHWINGTVAHRIAEEIYGDLEQLKSHK